jgi:ABC-type branched-subunit amino acid transport system substrate-binding protein
MSPYHLDVCLYSFNHRPGNNNLNKQLEFNMASVFTLTIKTCLIALSVYAMSFSSAIAQDDLVDLSFDELPHVKLNQKSVGFLENKKYNPNHIYFGLIVPYSQEKEHSLEIKRAIDLAIDEINHAGGVLGKNLELIAADDNDSNELTVLFVDSLMRTYKISALIGPTSSRRLMYLAKVHLPNHPVLIISPSASSSEISNLKDNDLIWRTTPSDVQQAKLGAHYLYNKLKKKSAAILYINDVYGSGLYRDFKDNYKGKVLSEVYYSPRVDAKTFDFTEKLNELFKDKPEAIYLITGGNDAAIITHQMAAGKYVTPVYKPVIFSVDAAKSRSFIEHGDKKIIEGVYGTSITNKNNEVFRKKYYDRYGKYPVSSYCERSYDIAYILALAMEKSLSTDHQDIKKELRSITKGGERIGPQDFARARDLLRTTRDIYYEGVSGKIEFDSKGDLASGFFEVWKITKGKYATCEILPSGEFK